MMSITILCAYRGPFFTEDKNSSFVGYLKNAANFRANIHVLGYLNTPEGGEDIDWARVSGSRQEKRELLHQRALCGLVPQNTR